MPSTQAGSVCACMHAWAWKILESLQESREKGTEGAVWVRSKREVPSSKGCWWLERCVDNQKWQWGQMWLGVEGAEPDCDKACPGLHEVTATHSPVAQPTPTPSFCMQVQVQGHPGLPAPGRKGASWNEAALLTKRLGVMESGWEVVKGGAFQLERGGRLSTKQLVAVIWKVKTIHVVYAPLMD